jgi:hypothetical protein
MLIGGVLLGAGMELDLRPGDYASGERPVRFIIERILNRTSEWVSLTGYERASETRPWRVCRVYVRIVALKRSLIIDPA